jgi:hypothetical protein
VTAPVKVRP